MTTAAREVYGGVDTHSKTHHVAAIDGVGRVLGDREFPATTVGYRQLIAWLEAYGPVAKVGVEGTGSYGAGLAAVLREHHVPVVEVDRPDRQARRRKGKSDPLDAFAAARAALSGEADGICEVSIRSGLGGIGGVIVTSGQSFQPDRMFAAVIVLLVLAMALTAFVGVVERRIAPWNRAITGRGE